MDAFEQMMQFNGMAFEKRNFDSAYHSLLAAIYLVENDDARLQRIGERATEQGKWFDTNLPEHRLASHVGRKDNFEAVRLQSANLRFRLQNARVRNGHGT